MGRGGDRVGRVIRGREGVCQERQEGRGGEGREEWE